MLRDELYTLTRLEDEGPEARFRVRLDPSHPLFKGHFPLQPVLPGVCTLTMLRDSLALVEGHPVRLAAIRDCKFTAPVDPRLTQELELRLRTDRGTVQATALDGQRILLKLKASYIPTHD